MFGLSDIYCSDLHGIDLAATNFRGETLQSIGWQPWKQRKLPGVCFFLGPQKIWSKCTDLSLLHFFFTEREKLPPLPYKQSVNTKCYTNACGHVPTAPVGLSPIPPVHPMQSCFAQYGVTQNAHVFGLESFVLKGFGLFWQLGFVLDFILQKYCSSFVYL